MKKLPFLLIITLLFSCAQPVKEPQPSSETVEPTPTQTPEERADQIEADLINTNSVSSVLDMYVNIYGMEIFPFNAICTRCVYCGYEEELDFLVEKFSNVPAGSLNCLRAKWCSITRGSPEFSSVTYEDNSDECILMRRPIKPSKISYFNYKKYIPESTGLKTEDDFINLYKMYWALKSTESFISISLLPKYAMRTCITRSELTTKEQEQCDQEKENFLKDMASGRAKKCSLKYPKQWAVIKKWDTGSIMQFGAINLCIPDNISKINYPF